MAAVLLRPDVGTVWSRDASSADGRRRRRASGRGRSRAGRVPNQSNRSRPGTVSSTIPTRARSVSSGGIRPSRRSRSPPSGQTVHRCSWRIDDPGRGRDLDATIAVDRPARARRAVARRPVEAPARPTVAPDPPIRSLSVGARHRASAGDAASSGWTRRAVIVDDRPVAPPASVATPSRAARRGPERHLEAADLEARRRPAPALAGRTSGWCSQLSPRSAPVPDSPAGRRGRSPGAEAGSRARRRRRPGRRSPASQRGLAASQVAKSWRFAISAGRPSSPVERRSPTGAASARCSHSAGFGRRSGQTRPSAQKLPSFGSSPKSPP